MKKKVIISVIIVIILVILFVGFVLWNILSKEIYAIITSVGFFLGFGLNVEKIYNLLFNLFNRDIAKKKEKEAVESKKYFEGMLNQINKKLESLESKNDNNDYGEEIRKLQTEYIKYMIIMLSYLLEKEFKQFLRNSFLPRLVVALPFVALAVFPLIANMDVKNLVLAVIDSDRSQTSRQVEEKIASSGYFRIYDYFSDSKVALQSIEKGKADILLEIPPKFEESLNRENSANLMISANAVNAMKGGLGSAYLTGIITDYNRELITKQFPEAVKANPKVPFC